MIKMDQSESSSSHSILMTLSKTGCGVFGLGVSLKCHVTLRCTGMAGKLRRAVHGFFRINSIIFSTAFSKHYNYSV